MTKFKNKLLEFWLELVKPVALTRRAAFSIFIVSAFFVTLLGWGSDYRSCVRGSELNQAYNRTIDSQKELGERAIARSVKNIETNKVKNPQSAALSRQAILDTRASLKGLNRAADLSCAKIFPDAG